MGCLIPYQVLTAPDGRGSIGRRQRRFEAGH
jgi:hypothetical protein